MSVAVAEDLLEPRYSFANAVGKALKSHFSEFFALYLIPSIFLLLPKGFS